MSKLSVIGKQVGNYVIKALLGRGGMAKVYVAEHPRIGRQVAVKVLAPHLALEPRMAQRFEIEAMAAARLQHPNIIEIYDFGTLDDGTPYYTMELLEGRELRQVVGHKPRWSAWEIQPYLEQIGSALAAAHEQQMVHRDLKPENIFVLEGEPLRLKILDFGLAKMLEDGGDAMLTTTGMVLGSPVYAAPEQLSGTPGKITTRTDIYSLGVILYWALCGSPPFEARTSGMLIAQHLKDPPPPLATRAPAVPQDVADLIHRCLEKDPGRRPATVTQVVKQYNEALKQQSAEKMDDLEQQLAASSEPAGDGLPGDELSNSLVAFLGIPQGKREETDDVATEKVGETETNPSSPRLEPRMPAPPTGTPQREAAVALPTLGEAVSQRTRSRAETAASTAPGTSKVPLPAPPEPAPLAEPALPVEPAPSLEPTPLAEPAPPLAPAPPAAAVPPVELPLPPPVDLLPADLPPPTEPPVAAAVLPLKLPTGPPAQAGEQRPPLVRSSTAPADQAPSRPQTHAFVEAESHAATGFMTLEELVSGAARDGQSGGGQPDDLDHRPTVTALPLIGDSVDQPDLEDDRPTEVALPLLGEMPVEEQPEDDEDDCPTEVALPLLGEMDQPWESDERPAELALPVEETAEQDLDDGRSTSILGLIGDEEL